MSKLAYLGGKPITPNLLEKSELISRPDLERENLLKAYDSGVWDHWPGQESMASEFEKEWAEFNGSEFCALLTNGTHAIQVALETLDIGAGDEVIVPGLTWQATASAVCDVNAVPDNVNFRQLHGKRIRRACKNVCVAIVRIKRHRRPDIRVSLPMINRLSEEYFEREQ